MQVNYERPKIHLSSRPHDFSGWFAEKSMAGLKHLSQAVDYVKAEEGLYHLRAAVTYQVALVAMVEGFEDALDLQEDAALIMGEGYLGYQKFLKKYGVRETG